MPKLVYLLLQTAFPIAILVFFTITTLILYSLAAFNDPGYVKTNLFKVETENRENKMLEKNMKFNKNDLKGKKYDRTEFAFEVSENQLRAQSDKNNAIGDEDILDADELYGRDLDEGEDEIIQIIDENKIFHQQNQNIDNDELLDDEEDDEGPPIDIERDLQDEHFTSQAVDLNKKRNTKKLITDDDSNISQVARDFFMQTHGDRGASFDLLQKEAEMREEPDLDDDKENIINVDIDKKSFKTFENGKTQDFVIFDQNGPGKGSKHDNFEAIIDKYNLRLTSQYEDKNSNKQDNRVLQTKSIDTNVMINKEEMQFQESIKVQQIHYTIVNGIFQEFKNILSKSYANHENSINKQYYLLEKSIQNDLNAIRLSIKHNRVEILKFILDNFHRIDLESKDQDGNNSLHLACLTGNIELIQMIFKMRPKLSLIPNNNMLTPIHITVKLKNPQAIQIFGSIINDILTVKDETFKRNMFQSENPFDFEVFQWILKSGLAKFIEENHLKNQSNEVKIQSYLKQFVYKGQQKPLQKQQISLLNEIFNFEDQKILQQYINNGEDYLSIKNCYYETIFHYAAKHNLIQLQQIIGRDTSILVKELEKQNYMGDTPLHIAGKNGSNEILKYYLDNVPASVQEILNNRGENVNDAVQANLELIKNKYPGFKFQNSKE
ncbi:ankyrin repeat domain protein [Stylonychia lemnae]|uniref:Ankyrin repeat domain protein n=1 Tax=Stylonychia lemnae TaxID=5949 RepID=A0A078B295_STYLE|nr:ankyrin repeat domain protein [Stylonychia lemnae]|eukprot:CDW88604.1 ankyrin repeat domain protein [Stylonychia lemnae]